MIEPPVPDDEEKRLALLRACKIMDTPAEAAFDDVARLAAELCGTEIALITLVDADRQWFKARVGVERTDTPRDLSFCGHCITGASAMIVPDTHLDPRFVDNPLVTGEPGIRFYAGVPLEVEPGSAIGALSVADRKPRTLTERQLESLRRLSRQVAKELRLRRDLQQVTTELAIHPGDVVGGRWTITREIGRGGVGAVFEAKDAGGQRVAIKVLLPAWRENEQVVDRFAREARVLMQLRSPHVGRLLDVGNLEAIHGELPYLVLEYLEGMDLQRLVEKRGPLPYRQAFHWIADACDGVGEAHALGVVHRDLKPSNVFLAQQEEGPPIVKVLDFGIAAGDPSRREVKLTAVDALMGSPGYMAPEQILSSADVDARSDVWSMGVTLYEVLSGSVPFPGDTDLQVFAAVMTRPPVPLRERLPGVSPAVEAVLDRCMARERADRWPSMAELAQALRTAGTR